MARVVKLQIDSVLRFMNLPSRSQIDQLVEHAVGLEERFDDLETESRQMRQTLRMSTDALGELKQELTSLAVQLADLNPSQTTTDALGDLKQDLTALAAQLAGMNQHLEAIEARAERMPQPGAQPPAQPSRPRSRRKSPPSS